MSGCDRGYYLCRRFGLRLVSGGTGQADSHLPLMHDFCANIPLVEGFGEGQFHLFEGLTALLIPPSSNGVLLGNVVRTRRLEASRDVLQGGSHPMRLSSGSRRVHQVVVEEAFAIYLVFILKQTTIKVFLLGTYNTNKGESK